MDRREWRVKVVNAGSGYTIGYKTLKVTLIVQKAMYHDRSLKSHTVISNKDHVYIGRLTVMGPYTYINMRAIILLCAFHFYSFISVTTSNTYNY